MREAAADLNFEEAARLRDEVKRLRATELAVVDDPTAKQRSVAGKAGAYAGAKKYGDAANLPAQTLAPKRGGNNTAAVEAQRSKVHKPDLDEMGIATWHEVKTSARQEGRAPAQADARRNGPGHREQDLSADHQPRLRPGIRPRRRARSGGAPGHRGGWKKR